MRLIVPNNHSKCRIQYVHCDCFFLYFWCFSLYFWWEFIIIVRFFFQILSSMINWYLFYESLLVFKNYTSLYQHISVYQMHTIRRYLNSLYESFDLSLWRQKSFWRQSLSIDYFIITNLKFEWNNLEFDGKPRTNKHLIGKSCLHPADKMMKRSY